MSKDPAFLFYSSDFMTGCMFLTNEQVGKYIKLMCAQHQKGHLSEKDMLNICQTYDEDIFSKFTKDEQGRYYNERLEAEITKRKKYSESRSKNRLNKANNKENKENNEQKFDDDVIDICQTYVRHMENENENINKNDIKEENKEKKQPKLFVDDSGKPYDKFEPNGRTFEPKQDQVNFESMEQVARVLKASSWVAVYAKSCSMPLTEDPTEWIDKFTAHAVVTGKNHLSLDDFKSHCFYWTKQQIEKGVRLKAEARTKPKEVDAITRANRLAAERMEALKNGK